jgi:hypothetical protein
VKYCPECVAEYADAYAACPSCRVILVDHHPERADDPEVVHRVPDAAAGALLCGMLEHHGIRAVLRTATLPGYGTVRRDWSTTAWGEIVTPVAEAREARSLIATYLQALERGGRVRDEDVEEAGDGA